MEHQKETHAHSQGNELVTNSGEHKRTLTRTHTIVYGEEENILYERKQ